MDWECWHWKQSVEVLTQEFLLVVIREHSWTYPNCRMGKDKVKYFKEPTTTKEPAAGFGRHCWNDCDRPGHLLQGSGRRCCGFSSASSAVTICLWGSVWIFVCRIRLGREIQNRGYGVGHKHRRRGGAGFTCWPLTHCGFLEFQSRFCSCKYWKRINFLDVCDKPCIGQISSPIPNIYWRPESQHFPVDQ